MRTTAIITAFFLSASGSGVSATTHPEQNIYSLNADTTWKGFRAKTLTISGRNALIVYPQKSAKGNPWIWRTEFFGHEPQADSVLLTKGFHVVYIDVQNMYGAPKAVQLMADFYEYLTREEHLNKKTVLEGFSRGGLFALNWAEKNPDKTSCLYLDAPVCDFKSWPGTNRGFDNDWTLLKEVYDFHSDEEALRYPSNPVDNLQPLASYKVPILSVCGTADTIVPIKDNSGLLKTRYEALGGKMTIIEKKGVGHHPHSLKDPSPIVSFILKNRLK